MHPEVPIKRILIPIDFSDPSRRAFYAGLSLAAKYDADAWILHVSEPLRSFDFGKKKYVETKDTIERVEEGVRRRVDELREAEGASAVDRRRIHILVRGGKAAHEIVDTAQAKEVDLIVMGRSGAGGGLIGSTSERVLRNASCSVFCVKVRTPE